MPLEGQAGFRRMYRVVPKSCPSSGEAVLDRPLSRAQVFLAPSICLRLAMQAVLALVSRALTKFGIATAANRAIMATTTMISTRVKPVFRQLFLLILLIFHVGGVNDGERLVIIIRLQSFTDCLSPAAGQFLSKLSAGFFCLQRAPRPC